MLLQPLGRPPPPPLFRYVSQALLVLSHHNQTSPAGRNIRDRILQSSSAFTLNLSVSKRCRVFLDMRTIYIGIRLQLIVFICLVVVVSLAILAIVAVSIGGLSFKSGFAHLT